MIKENTTNNKFYMYNVAPCWWPPKYWLLETDEERDKWKKDHYIELIEYERKPDGTFFLKFEHPWYTPTLDEIRSWWKEN